MKTRNSWFLLVASVLALPGVSAAQEKQFAKEIGTAGVLPSECDGVADNLVMNCGFETMFSGWMRSGDQGFTAVDAAARHSGVLGLNTGPIGSLGFFEQTLVTTPGESYDLTYWLRNMGRPARFQISWDGEIVADDPLSDHADHPYQQYSLSGLIAATDATVIKFGFFNVPDFFWFDDVVVTVTVPVEKR
jgi:hypothetical protein